MKYLKRILRRGMARSDYIIKDYLGAMKTSETGETGLEAITMVPWPSVY